MKRILIVTSAFVLLLVFTGCENLGKEKVFNGVQLYHTEGVSDTLADALGKYLVSSQFADGKAKTVQLTKVGATYHFRFVVKEGSDKDTALVRSTKYFASLLSAEVFNGAPVQIEMCDDLMNTEKTFDSTELGKKTIVNGLELYHTSAITSAQLDSLYRFLVKSKFANGRAKTAQIAKSGGTYQFRMVVIEQSAKDPGYIKTAKTYADDISADVFGGAPVEIDLCDDYLNTEVVVPMDAGAKK